MSLLSVVIITRNEENNLARCLQSVDWADEVIVMDSHSIDKTRQIAGEYGAKVHTCDWRGYGPAKQEGVRQARGKWILSLDADEEISSALKSDINNVISQNGSDTAGYVVPRRTRFLGRWIYHCGWYPDPVLRLFRRDRGNFNDAVVHEKVIVDGKIGHLSGEILHYSYPSLEEYFRKFNHYTTLGAEEAFRRGRTAGTMHLVVSPFISFIRHYFIRRGFLDGMEGFIISILSSCAVFVKYAKLRNMYREEKKRSGTADE